MFSAQLALIHLTVPAVNIPMAFRCGFVLLLALVMVLMKEDDKTKTKMKKYP